MGMEEISLSMKNLSMWLSSVHIPYKPQEDKPFLDLTNKESPVLMGIENLILRWLVKSYR